jgi:hypothetical protein
LALGDELVDVLEQASLLFRVEVRLLDIGAAGSSRAPPLLTVT